jgi:hypothetical protein
MGGPGSGRKQCGLDGFSSHRSALTEPVLAIADADEDRDYDQAWENLFRTLRALGWVHCQQKACQLGGGTTEA